MQLRTAEKKVSAARGSKRKKGTLSVKKLEAKTKRKILSLLIAAAIFVLCTGGTLAYYAASDVAHNVITTSNGAKVELLEWQLDERGNLTPYPEEEITGIMPGMSVSKIPMASALEGSEDVWVRMRTNTSITLVTGDAGDPGLISLDYNTGAWTQGADGWWYFNAKLSAGVQTDALFTKVTFDPKMPNEYQNSHALVKVEMQAVQAKNNGSNAMEASGWPDGSTEPGGGFLLDGSGNKGSGE